MTDDKELQLQALLSEYSSLREESMAAIEHRMTATNFTFAAMAVIIAALLTSHTDPRVVVVFLGVGLPQLAKAGLLIWLGEYERSQRAGRHLCQVEAAINARVGDEVLTWERGLSSTRIHMGYPYRAVVVLLLGTGWLAAVTAVALAWWVPSGGDLAFGSRWWSAPALVTLVVGEAWFFMRFWGFWVRAKTGSS